MPCPCSPIISSGKQIPNLVVASPDVGFGKQAYRFAKLMGTSVVIANKVRHEHDESAEVLDIIGTVEGKNVLIVDDFTISGGTLIEMAHACKSRGARDIYACVSHGVFSKGSAAKIAASPIKELVVTDTIGYREEKLAPCCKVSASPACLPRPSTRSTAAKASAGSSTRPRCKTRSPQDCHNRGPTAIPGAEHGV